MSTTLDDDEMGTIAAKYAERGWAVLPLHTVINQQCSCGKADCSSPGKHPLNPNGLTGATTDATQIVSWWAQWPWANIGIATGRISGLAVLDIDPRNDGFNSMPALSLPDTLTARTGSGGLHLYYRLKHALRVRHAIRPGIDLQADGAYVVAPPSMHRQGSYCWLSERPIVDLPVTILGGIAAANEPATDALPPQTHGSIIEPDQKQWVSDLLAATCPEGQRNTTLTRLAGYFRNLLPERVTLTLLRDWNRTRCIPPLADTEIAQNVRHKYQRYEGAPEDKPSPLWTVTSLLETEFPELPSIVEGLVYPGLGFLAGRPKRGKSWLVLQLALAVVHGQPFLNRETLQGPVIYIALEDSPRRLQSRLRLMRAEMTNELMFLNTFPSLDKGGIGRLAELIEQYHPRLIVIDTLSRVMGRRRDQDSNADMTEVLDPVQHLALDNDMCIQLVDHHRKPGIEINDLIDDIIGSTAKGGVADIIWGLYRKSGQSTGQLKITGRDVEETELAMLWDGLRFEWRAEGTVEDTTMRKRIQETVNYLRRVGEADVRSIGQYLELADDTILPLMREMKARRMVTETTIQAGQRGRPRFVYAITAVGMTEASNDGEE